MGKRDSYRSGVLLMMMVIVWLSIIHVCTKWLNLNSPNISSLDITLVICIVSLIVNVSGSYIKGIKLNHNLYGNKLFGITMIRVLLSTLNNYMFLYGIRHVPLSKGILIFSLNPIFCTIVAAILIKEQLDFHNIISTIGALIGIYLLTLNKPDTAKQQTYELFGYIALLGWAIVYGSIFVLLRHLGQNNVHWMFITFYISFINFGFASAAMMSGLFEIAFPYYSPTELCFMIVIGLAANSLGIFMSLATTYTTASNVTPLTNLENVVTVLADIFVPTDALLQWIKDTLEDATYFKIPGVIVKPEK